MAQLGVRSIAQQGRTALPSEALVLGKWRTPTPDDPARAPGREENRSAVSGKLRRERESATTRVGAGSPYESINRVGRVQCKVQLWK